MLRNLPLEHQVLVLALCLPKRPSKLLHLLVVGHHHHLLLVLFKGLLVRLEGDFVLFERLGLVCGLFDCFPGDHWAHLHVATVGWGPDDEGGGGRGGGVCVGVGVGGRHG